MVEVYVERRKGSKPSHRTYEKLGVGPDKSGPLPLKDGTILDIDLKKVHPDYDWTWRNQGEGKDHWPVTVKVLSTPDVGPTQSPYLKQLAEQEPEGAITELDEKGVGVISVNNTRRLILKLDKPIWRRQETPEKDRYNPWVSYDHPVIEEYYPEYPELSNPASQTSSDKPAEVQEKKPDEYAWVDKLSEREIVAYSRRYYGQIPKELGDRLSIRARKLAAQEAERRAEGIHRRYWQDESWK